MPTGPKAWAMRGARDKRDERAACRDNRAACYYSLSPPVALVALIAAAASLASCHTQSVKAG